MAIRNIVKKGDEILSKKCRDVVDFDEKLHTLLTDMKETMDLANGVGIAAPQVGILRSVAIVLDIETDEIFEIINPTITKKSGEQNDVEGCLSLPGIYGYVSRPMNVTVDAFDRFGQPFSVDAEGFLARAFCHEIDHLNGNLFDDLVTEFVDRDEVE